MKCTEKKCGEEIDEKNSVCLMTGCGGCGSGTSRAYPCKKCGRLYWENGDPVFNRSEERAFLVNGMLINKK